MRILMAGEEGRTELKGCLSVFGTWWQKMEAELALAELTASRGAQSTALKQQLDAATAHAQDLQQQKDRAASELSVARQEVRVYGT